MAIVIAPAADLAEDIAKSDRRYRTGFMKSVSDGAKTLDIANILSVDDLATVAPPMDGMASPGDSGKAAREDHRHETDTSRASTDIATDSTNGLMAAMDFTKLSGLPDAVALATLLAGKAPLVNYSYTEQDTGIKWVDGKKIYWKTVNTGALEAGTRKQVEHGVSGMASQICIRGTGVDILGYYRPMPFTNEADVAAQILLNYNQQTIEIGVGTNRQNLSTSWATIWYTCTDR